MNEDYCMRKINSHRVMVSKYKAQEIYLERELLKSYAGDPSKLTMRKIVELLKTDSKTTPFSLRWELTNNCNLSCPFCYIHNHVKSEDIDFLVAKPYIDWLISNGLLFVTLTGGECTLNKDFLKIYTYFKKNGVLVKVFTNGIILSEEILKTYRQYKPYCIEISVYKRKEDDYRVYNNILKLKKEHINVLVKTTVTSTTYSEFQHIRKWCLDNDIRFKYDTEIFDSYDGTSNNEFLLSEEILTLLDRERFTDYTPENERADGIKCFDCNGGSVSILIDSLFNLRVCGKIKRKFHLYGRTMEEAYKELSDFVKKYKGKTINGCNSCRAYPICRMCYAFAIPQEIDGATEFCTDTTFCLQTQRHYDNLFGKNT